ncbi:MAG: glycoside hydrolase [Lentimicrobium sp.]|jgi:sialidase-1|nr:glycoside hydrolase [Lentimicrobium sp.]MDD2528298.1 sialidase family protein [Lentimicrobiaceae bacterium]MDD4598026.1 sialidase family protein [Lentimicrobiaceae bacterium]MDY0025167.1 sialidase family protein [Lentimicrobium sp.]
MKKPLLLFLCVFFSLLAMTQTNVAETMGPIFSLKIHKTPIFLERENNLFELSLFAEAGKLPGEIVAIRLHFTPKSNLDMLARMEVTDTSGLKYYSGQGVKSGQNILLPVNQKHNHRPLTLVFTFRLNANADLGKSLELDSAEVVFAMGQTIRVLPRERFEYRPALVLRTAGQDNCDTYRIPGLVTTNTGTLIAVYDNRYNNSKDLQENIDIGMSRSTDGGKTWEPMKVIMDMGKWGGRAENLNGIGDPCILYDDKNATIWVAALWMSGATEKDMLWWASRPGMTPTETGQFMLTKSTDNGLSWSTPINITDQIKDPSWQLLLQGPGKGICMKNGTLVFPVQFKKDIGEKSLDGGQFTCHSSIVYSVDGGESWEIGSGAKSNTTEAQVAELSDGSLMLNMRDDQNRADKSETNGRAVAITQNLGETWETHPSSNAALQEPNCMGSLISADILLDGQIQKILFFSNPNSKTERTNMTIKASKDEGLTWPLGFQIMLNETIGFGYSCLSMVDEYTVGILYEGVKDIYFQKVPVGDFFKAGK